MQDNKIYTSHLGVYGLIILDNQILLIRKNRGPYTGLLDLPGGSPEPHESLEDTLLREIKEEVGANVLEYAQASSFSAFFNYNQNNQDYCLRHIAIVYKVIIDGYIQYDLDSADSKGCVWVDLENVNETPISPLVREALAR